MTTFGRIISENVVEQYIIDLAWKWFDEYIAEVERQTGKDPKFFKPLADAITTVDFDKWTDDMLPCLLVMYTGTKEPPRRKGDGKWDACWIMGCAIVASANDKTSTREAVHAYGAAFKTMMLQHRSLEHPDTVTNVSWIDSRPAPIPSEDERTLGAVQMLFEVEVKDIHDERGKPPEPDPRPNPYVPTAELPVVEPDSGGVVVQP